jgi:hypothetical protein
LGHAGGGFSGESKGHDTYLPGNSAIDWTELCSADGEIPRPIRHRLRQGFCTRASRRITRIRENIVRMKVGIHSWWYLVSAARAAFIYLGSKRLLVLVIEVFFAVATLRAYRAPEGKRWAAIRSQWMLAIRDTFIVIFSIGVAVFGYELMWNQPNQSRLRQAEDSRSTPSALFDPIPTRFSLGPTNVFPRVDSRPICVQVLLPQGFPGGSYKLPYKPVAPSPPTLYNNGSPQREGIDYKVSGSTIVVKFQPASTDSLSVWYTTSDRFPTIVP